MDDKNEHGGESELRHLRARRRFLVIWLLLYLPAAVTVEAIAGTRVAVAAALVWMLMLWILAWSFGDSRCPRCGRQFFNHRRGVGNVWRRRCVHCGLALRTSKIAD
jgi:hypothetical protein